MSWIFLNLHVLIICFGWNSYFYFLGWYLSHFSIVSLSQNVFNALCLITIPFCLEMIFNIYCWWFGFLELFRVQLLGSFGAKSLLFILLQITMKTQLLFLKGYRRFLTVYTQKYSAILVVGFFKLFQSFLSSPVMHFL